MLDQIWLDWINQVHFTKINDKQFLLNVFVAYYIYEW